MDKMKRYANEKQLDQLNRHSVALSVIYPRPDGVHQTYLQMLEEAAGQGRTLEVQYDRGKGEVPLPRLFGLSQGAEFRRYFIIKIRVAIPTFIGLEAIGQQS
ncbi:hypothetical protein [Cohnella nanjingensis]|uniref:WYL domain-containing protein n=1 Tax=Cohnella nanjingensis TaxID=1387779 RepID=A0A7X0RUA5_9BACL|nr:hypothetical protein [Cohnella nanjingensis]MBB6673678.1 hypothetical protein [Cohnella nanjingensis]